MIKRVSLYIILSVILLSKLSLAQDTNSFWVGILRSDGVLIPFALHKEGKWSNPWSTVYKDISKTWYLWAQNGKFSELKVFDQIRYTSHCEEDFLGLSTDYKPELYNYSPYPKAGIATDTKQSVARMVEVSNKSSEITDVLSFIKPTFTKLETDAISKEIQEEDVINNRFKYTGHPVSEKDRAKTELSITKLYRNDSAISGQYIYYFEARKKYKKPLSFTDNLCEGISFLKGYILKKENELSFLDEKFVITDCDGTNLTTTLPFCIISIKEGNFIVAQVNGYESERYVIFKIDDSKVYKVVGVSGGGC